MIDNPKASNSRHSRHSRPYMHLVGPNPTLYTHPMNPESFGVSIPDLLEDLKENHDSYRVSKRKEESDSVAFYCFPSRLRMTLNNLQAQLGANPPSIQTILFAAVCSGIRSIESDSNVKELAELVGEYHLHAKEGDSFEIFTSNFLASFIGLKDDETGTRFNLPVTPQVKGRMCKVVSDTGIHLSSIALYAAYACLVEQPSTGEQSIEKWTGVLDNMLRSVRMKIAMVKVLMEELECTTWKRSGR